MKWLTQVNYMKHARQWLVFSVVLSVVCLVALGSLGLNRGIDFTGGVLMHVQYDAQVTSADVEAAASRATPLTPIVKGTVTTGTDNPNASEFLITVPELSPTEREVLLAELATVGTYRTLGEETVSASVSDELTRNAAMAIGIAALLQIAYIWWRFQFKFGVTAVIALLHDLVITLGLMALFKVQVNAAFVAAILTVLGYSMNDSVVVFDRIRENLTLRKKGESLESVATGSIQAVITRTIYTGVSVQIMLLAMIFLGGESVWDFAMTLFIGVTVGAYSSIFVATSLWLLWQNRDDNEKKSPAKIKPVRV